MSQLFCLQTLACAFHNSALHMASYKCSSAKECNNVNSIGLIKWVNTPCCEVSDREEKIYRLAASTPSKTAEEYVVDRYEYTDNSQQHIKRIGDTLRWAYAKTKNRPSKGYLIYNREMCNNWKFHTYMNPHPLEGNWHLSEQHRYTLAEHTITLQELRDEIKELRDEIHLGLKTSCL